MRVAALFALLPALASLAAAAPTASNSHSHSHAATRVRKSLSFGPAHHHASYEVDPDQPFSLKRDHADPVRAAAAFIQHQIGAGEGTGFYIREDVST
jgi:extracellular elastinolytic metalloproteinase